MNRIQEDYRVRLRREELRVVFNSTLVIVLLYAAGLAAAEAAGAFRWLVPSLTLHALILICALAQYALQPDSPYARVLPIFGLISLLRILSLVLPVGRFSPVYLNLLVAIPLLTGVWLTIKLLNLTPQELGFRKANFGKQFLIAASGLAFGLIAYFLLTPAALNLQNPWMLVLAICSLLLVGFVEELIFRGMLSQTLTQMLGTPGLVVSSVLFGIMYIETMSPGLVLLMVIIGFLFGLWMNRTRCLVGIGLAHGLLNVVAILVLPLVLPK